MRSLRQGNRCLLISVSLFLGWPASASVAGESGPPARPLSSLPDPSLAIFSDIPLDLKHVAPVLRHVIGVVESSIDVQREVKQFRVEYDSVKTSLAAVNSELEFVRGQQQQLTQQLALRERQQKERMESLREELEAKLHAELAKARQQIAEERQQDFARHVQAFEARQYDVIGRALGQELELKERELQQLSQEIDVQTQGLLERLTRLGASSDVAKSLERSTSQALADRKAALEARRTQLSAERNALLTKQRNGFIQNLTQQQEAEQEQRLTFKEASLRSSLAQLLRKTEQAEEAEVAQIRQALEAVRQRFARLVQQQAGLSIRAVAMDRELTSKVKSLEHLEAERQASFGQLERAFQKPDPVVRPEALAWLGRAIGSLPAEVAAELVPLQQRLVASAEQEQRLQVRRRMVRERQQALQLSREMESQHEQVRLRQQQEQEDRSRKAEELLARANQLAGQEKFDEALQVLSQAQALSPPQLNTVAAVREEMITAKARTLREAQTERTERLFTQAMGAFERGRYEEAVALFEQVIAQEASLDRSVQVAGGTAP